MELQSGVEHKHKRVFCKEQRGNMCEPPDSLFNFRTETCPSIKLVLMCFADPGVMIHILINYFKDSEII